MHSTPSSIDLLTPAGKILGGEPSGYDPNGTPRYIRQAYLNRFRPPVIKGFPNGLASNTTVEYAVITTDSAQSAGVYTESNTPLATGDLATRYTMAPLRVASSVNADDGIGGTATTTYKYFDMRASASGRGPQGFGKIAVTDPSGMTTTTTFAQGYPYTGKPTTVERKNSHGLVTTTVTHYNQVSPPGPRTSTFIYPKTVTDTSYLQSSDPSSPVAQSETITTTTNFTYDEAHGNPTDIVVTTTSSADGGSFKKETVNTYGDAGSTLESMGKLTKAVVTTTQLTAVSGGTISPAITHTTEFEYEYNAVGWYRLHRKKVEPGSSIPNTELWTAYDYDDYGNVTTTTSCASDFDSCDYGAIGPSDTGNDPAHPPFRTTKVSYDPADWDSSVAAVPGHVTSLSYHYCVRGAWAGSPFRDRLPHRALDGRASVMARLRLGPLAVQKLASHGQRSRNTGHGLRTGKRWTAAA